MNQMVTLQGLQIHERNARDLQSIRTAITQEDYLAAISLLRQAGDDREIRNMLAVCLMRAGQARDAVQIYRQLVLVQGCTWIRPEIPDSYKRNYATALMLSGYPNGALEILRETDDVDDLVAVRIRVAIQNWVKTLSFWRRLDWKINRIEPPLANIPFEHVPGEFECDVHRPQPSGPKQPSENLSMAA